MIAASGDVVDQHRRIRRGLAALSARAEAAGFTEPIHVETLVPEIAREIDEAAAPSGFLSAGVTFCAIVPMRSIPFRVVCLLGMNDGAFPRIARPPGFDLTTREPRRGDRSRRDDDRYAFLETLLSARERLLVSYVGRSVRDNSVIPPSVVVNDVIDALAQSFVLDSNREADAITRRAELVRRLVVQHPLQPFSPAAFRKDRRDRRLFSYSTAAFEGACAERHGAATPPSFVEGPISDDRPESSSVSLDELERFLVHPSRWFCQQRLGLFLGLEADLLADREPIEIDALERWGLGDRLLSELVAGASLEEGRAALRAGGLLPPGALGLAVYAGVAPAARRIADRVRQLTAEARLEPISVDLEVGGLRLHGVLRDVWACGQVSWRFPGSAADTSWRSGFAISSCSWWPPRAPRTGRSCSGSRPTSTRRSKLASRRSPLRLASSNAWSCSTAKPRSGLRPSFRRPRAFSCASSSRRGGGARPMPSTVRWKGLARRLPPARSTAENPVIGT